MADIETTLKTRTNQDNVFPNIHTANIPDGGVTTAKIADNAVTRYKIADGAVHSNHLDASSVTEGKISNGAVTESKLATGSVTLAKMGLNCVDTVQIVDGAITSAKIANEGVNTINIADGAVSATEMNLGMVTLKSLYDQAISGGGDFTDFVQSIYDIIDDNPFYFLRYNASGPGVYDRGTVQFFSDEPQTFTLTIGGTDHTIGDPLSAGDIAILTKTWLIWVYSE